MTSCKILSKEMIPNAIELNIEAKDLDFDHAREIADQKANEKVESPMLLAWYERKSGNFSPRVECCSADKPGWLVYAESRGGNIIIDINSQDYVFVYVPGSILLN